MPAEQLAERAEELKQYVAQMFYAAPHAVPPTDASVAWTPLIVAEFQQFTDAAANQPMNATTAALRKLLDAYAQDDAATFNRQIGELRRTFASYEQVVDASEAQLLAAGAKSSELLSQGRVNFEVFFNRLSPFYYCAALYVLAFVLGVWSWLGWTGPLRKASNWLLLLTFVVHTLALATRIYISGRPPVTNLYSSAVFIGWGAVLLAIVIEYIYRLGLANIAAAVIGFATLVVAHFLSLDGDTMIVMQAVLDTQFWLATHVVCIALGYSTTYVAGTLGVLYLLLGYLFPVLSDDHRRQLSRMIYGTLCFAILFSFWGTVLGGLWADDSWGRFWGWDPKENGALIIVLYNALVLHARWGAIVKERGFALLAVGGNIVVTWSWFGVNELGVGLHAYGASESSTAMWLLIFAASQLAIIAVGAIPLRWLRGNGSRREASAA
jgi:ABC-type transport system involved in cytochrome c biogenesis permease subunit